jgi:hypothetical protein
MKLQQIIKTVELRRNNFSTPSYDSEPALNHRSIFPQLTACRQSFSGGAKVGANTIQNENKTWQIYHFKTNGKKLSFIQWI